MTVVAVAAATATIGLLGLVVAVRPSPASTGAAASWPRAAAGLLTSDAGAVGARGTVASWLRITDGSPDQLVRRVVAMALGGGGAALGLVVTAWCVGSAGAGSLVLVVIAASIGASIPVADLHRRAVEARRAASGAVGTYLDLVVLCLAGGMGVEGALQAAAGVADDPWSARLAHAVAVAADAGRPPWEGLAELGASLGLEVLGELAATMALAGVEGARVRDTLLAKAASLRTRQLAAAESAANAVTERLFLPGVPLLLGFLVFIGYPAVARILTGL